MVVPLTVKFPVTVVLPLTVRFELAASVVNDPAAAVDPPIITPSIVPSPPVSVIATVPPLTVNAVAAEFEPIVTPSIAPPLMSALSILTDPVPFGVSVMSPLVTRPVIVDAVFEMFVTPKSVDAVLKIAVSLFAAVSYTHLRAHET